MQLEDGVKVFRAMLAGNIDVGMSPGAVTIIGRSNGAAVKVILANSNKFEASMIVRDNVKDMADLKGKRIGIQQPGGFADLLSRSVLKAAKIDPKDVNFVTIAIRGRAGAGRRSGRHRHPPCRAGDAGQRARCRRCTPSPACGNVQPKTLYTPAVATEKTIADKPAALEAFVKANIEAMRVMYTDKAKVMPILVKFTGYPEKIISDTYDFMVKNCIWDANTGLGPERYTFTADLMTKVGNIKEGKTPKYEDVVDLQFGKKAIDQLGEWKGPVCPTAAF